MRFLMILIAVLTVLYGGYWFVGRSLVENGFESAISDLVDDGWQISYSDLSTQGFPARFDTTIRDISVVHPTNGIGWATPQLQIFALSYRPTQMIAVWPERQIITLPYDRLTVTADGLRASAGVQLKLAAPLDKVTVESGPMTIASEQGWQIGIDQSLFAFRRMGPDPAEYDVFFEASSILPPVELKSLIDPANTLPAALDVARIDAHVVLNQPLDRNMSGEVRPTMIVLREFQVVWGEIGIRADGNLTISSEGVPEGQVTLSAQNWRQVIALGVAAGVIPPRMGRLAEGAGAMLSQGSDTLTAPVVFQNGQVLLGTIPLGPSPVFR